MLGLWCRACLQPPSVCTKASAVYAEPSWSSKPCQNVGCLHPCACSAQERKGEKRATLNQLLDDFHKAAKKAGSSSCTLSGREEQEWLVQEMILQGLLTFEFGFTAYNTNTYLVATPNSSRLGRQRCVHVMRRVEWLDGHCCWCQSRNLSCTPTSTTMPLAGW